MKEYLARQGFAEEAEPEEDYQEGLCLTFRIGKEDFGLAIRHVTEIIGIQKITEAPDMPPHVKGVINLRGKVIPVMDVRLRFGMESREYDERTCIIVVRVEGKSVGLVVDQVNEVASIQEDQIEPPPHAGHGGTKSYIHGMGKIGEEVKILLDVPRLLFQNGSEEFLPEN